MILIIINDITKGPGHYQIDYSKLSSEPGIRVHAVPKAKGNNFIDKVPKRSIV